MIAYIIRENSSPCMGIVFAAFSKYEYAEKYISKNYKKLGFDREDELWIECHELDSKIDGEDTEDE